MTQPARHLQLVESQLVESQLESQPIDPLVGQIVDGRYRVEAVLGQGGMGLVYRAVHHVLGKPLALKVLRPEVSRDTDVMERFRREAQAASAIGSPHICDVSDFGSLPDGSTYFVMEFLDGPSLTKAMLEERPMSPARIVAIARQLCDALGAAHARGIVHRDLKPDNVHLIGRGADRDFVKVLDFGIAKVAGGADKKLTQAGQIFGTPHYMSPEQCSGRDVDHRTDIYALGVMLYEMACGHVPFDSDTLMGVLTKHVYEQPLPPHQLTPPVAVPPGLEAVILKCLAKRADERYPTMAALREDLDALERGTTPAAVRDGVDRAAHVVSSPALWTGPAKPSEVPAEEPRSRAPLMIGALATLLLVGSGAFAAVYFGGIFGGASVAVEQREPVAREPEPVPEEEVVAEDTSEPERTETAVVEDVTLGEAANTVEAAPIQLATDPSGALVYDASGALLGSTPMPLPRPEGGEPVRYRVELAGYRSVTLPISARTSSQLTLSLVRERRGGARREPIIVNTVGNTGGGSPLGGNTTTTTTTTTRTHHGGVQIDDGIIDPFGDPPQRPRPPLR